MKLCDFEVGLQQPFFLIAGPCVVESLELARDTAGQLQEITQQLQIPFIYKSSFDKANRSSGDSFRGLGIEKGLQILAQVKKEFNLPVLTDVHEDTPMQEAACNIPVNIKKGQFLSPAEMKHVVDKAKAQGNENIMVCERGASFGYNNLVSDMRSLAIMRDTGCPVEFDATHSVQLPGGNDGSSGGQREFVPVLARAAIASGVSGLFMETHPNPQAAKSDGPNSWPLSKIKELLEQLKEIDQVVKQSGFIEQELLN